MPDDLVSQVYAALQTSNWKALAVLGVVSAVWAARTYGARWLPWLKTDRGGAALALLTGVAMSLATSLSASQPTLETVTNGLWLGAQSSGWFVLLRKLIMPSDGAPSNAAPVAPADPGVGS